MSGPPEIAPPRHRDSRLAVLVAMTVVATLFAVVQRTPFAPLPHAIDGFVTGLAIGFGLSALIGWIGARD